MSTIGKFIDSSPDPKILKITGRPCYEILKPMHRKINANTSSISTNLGVGINGYQGTTTQTG